MPTITYYDKDWKKSPDFTRADAYELMFIKNASNVETKHLFNAGILSTKCKQYYLITKRRNLGKKISLSEDDFIRAFEKSLKDMSLESLQVGYQLEESLDEMIDEMFPNKMFEE